MSGLSDNLAEDVAVLGLIVGLFLYFRWKNNRPAKKAIGGIDASLLMSMYTMGVDLKKVSAGELQGYPYSILVTSSLKTADEPVEYHLGFDEAPTSDSGSILPEGVLRSPADQVILSVELPTACQVHFAGFSFQDPHFQSLLENTSLDNILGQVQLEGDFPDYFKLYCDKGREIELLEILDPTRMLFLVDFCKKFNWELIGKELYFVQSDSVSRDEQNSNMVGAATQFAQKILPTLQRMSQNT